MCVCWFLLYNFKNNQNFFWSSCKITRYSCLIVMKFGFSRHIMEESHISNFIKIHPLGAEMFHADRRTSITKLIIAIRHFANAPEDHSFPQTRRLKCFNAFVINVLSTGPTKRFNLYWTT